MPKFAILAADGKTIVQIGECPSDDISLQPLPPGGSIITLSDGASPASGLVEYDAARKSLVPHLPGIKRQRVAALGGQCAALITGGFQSEATGLWREYPSNPTDQANMQQVALAGGLLMAKTGGEWGLVSHTAAQGVNVLADFRGHCDAARQLLADRRAAVMAAHTPEQIAEITLS